MNRWVILQRLPSIETLRWSYIIISFLSQLSLCLRAGKSLNRILFVSIRAETFFYAATLFWFFLSAGGSEKSREKKNSSTFFLLLSSAVWEEKSNGKEERRQNCLPLFVKQLINRPWPTKRWKRFFAFSCYCLWRYAMWIIAINDWGRNIASKTRIAWIAALDRRAHCPGLE